MVIGNRLHQDHPLILLGWILLAFPVVVALYAYVVYPWILGLLAKRRAPRASVATELPTVSIVIPAYNEERQIAGAVEAAIAQDYPAEKRQILVLSDASTDRTDEIVRGYASQGVELLRMTVRGGKTAAENASVPHLRGAVIINTDSSVRLHPRAVRLLAEAMADPAVGVASTRDVSIAHVSSTSNTTEAGYVDYEMNIRALETATGGIVGASGSGYAIRADLHRIPIRADLSRDFSAALTARTHGFRAVSVDDALCYVPRTTSLRAEYRRKVRTIARGMETLAWHGHLLDPTRYGLFAWKLLSHKVARWLLPEAAIIGATGIFFLARRHTLAMAALYGGSALAVVAVGLALYCWRTKSVPAKLSSLMFAAAGNIAVVHALLRVMMGHEDHLWEPTRRPAPIDVAGSGASAMSGAAGAAGAAT